MEVKAKAHAATHEHREIENGGVVIVIFCWPVYWLPQILFGQSVIGIELKCMFEVCSGFGEASQLGEGASQICFGVGIVGLQLQG